jgi:hypothetical protein
MRQRSIIVLFIILFLGVWTRSALAAALQGSGPKDEVLAVILRFQEGIEKGDETLGDLLCTKNISESFVQFYKMLARLYSQNRMAFPMKIGHIKILQDGRAKAEVRINPNEDLIVFTFVQENGSWKFSHMEGILFPLFDVPPAPASAALALPPDRVKWMMCEKDVAFMNEVFFKLKTALGPETAREFFVKRGEGFKVAMDAWLPFIEGAAQFALFYGILEENYYGSKYTVLSAGEDEAEMRFAPLQELEVMKIAYFTPKMTLDEYHALYRDIMIERARVCSLDLEVRFEGTDCTLIIKKRNLKVYHKLP